ncbi:MAG: tetratricopeptide repeat protein [bacterium]|nr:tetratricopeptide repeat protein [bacterium]
MKSTPTSRTVASPGTLLCLTLAGWCLTLTGCEAPTAQPPPTADREEAEQPAVVETTSLLGETLYRPVLDEDFRRRQEEFLAAAQADLEASSDAPDARIWVGRRSAYLGRYREAIEIFTQGLARHPEDARFYRHRGHRYITVRELDPAVADLERAVELIAGTAPVIEPDGLPNARNQPTGNSHTAIWYHLGLAHYLRGDFESALDAYLECRRYSDNPDMLVATSHWLYMTLRRLGREDEAAAVLEPISADMDIIENHEYHALLLMYRGERSPDDLNAADAPALGYGVGNWYFFNGQPEKGLEWFRKVVATDEWAAFGYIAAEAELAGALP